MTTTDEATTREATATSGDGTVLDAAAAEEFAGRVLGVFNDGCIALMTSIGYQTGLFDTLHRLPPSTSDEIATAAGLDERYVREWLNAMTTARFVDHDPVARTYVLPPERAASLTTAAGPDNLARMMPFIPMLAEVEPQIVECFHRGGGLPYSAYDRFHDVMADTSAAVADAALVDVILPLAHGLPERLHRGIDVLDIGCGRGHAINVMARAFPRSRFTGYDFSDEAIQHARREVAELTVTNARFEVVDVARLEELESYDLVTAFDAVHDQADPAGVLRRAAQALRPGGTFLMVDIRASSYVEDNIDVPWGTFLYTVSTMHCMSVSLGLDGAGLGTAWGEQLAVRMLHEAGFAEVDVNHLDEEPFNTYYVARR